MTTPRGPERAAAIYVRRSSRKDLGLNRSLREQEAECRALAARLGLDVVDVFAEREGTGASTRSRKARPEWSRALADLDNGERFRTLIVWALDRADRRGADTLAALLTRHAATGRRIVSPDGLDTSDERQRLATIIRGEIAREEAESTAKRVARTKASRRADGLWLGGRPPYGLRVAGGKVEPDPEAAPVARRIADAVLNGETLWATVRQLNDEGVPGPGGGAWRVGSVSAMLRAPAFAGLQAIRGRTASGGWQAVAEVYRDAETGAPVSVGEGIITATERSLILARLEARSAERGRGETRGARAAAHVLGEVLRCAGCGGRGVVTGAAASRSYRCAAAGTGAGTCPAPFTCPAPALDAYVVGRFLNYLAALEPEDPRLAAVAERWTAHVDPASVEERQAAEEAVEAVEADLARVRRLAVSGVLTEDEAAAELPRLRALLATATRARDALPAGALDVGPLLDLAESREAWEGLPVSEQRALLPVALERVEVCRARTRGVRFVPEERVVLAWRG